MAEKHDMNHQKARPAAQNKKRPAGQAPRKPAPNNTARQQQRRPAGQTPRQIRQGAERAAAPRPVQQRRPASQRRPEPRREETVSTMDFASIVRGIIAVGLTCLIVCIIVIMFAKTLFVSDAELQKTAKTGHLTETAFEMIEPVEQQLREEVVTTKATKKKKKTTTVAQASPEEDSQPADLPEGIDTGIAGEYTVNSPVYLHPTPDANAANLATLPYGATVKILGSSYGWYYLEYEGEKGYAWGTYFTKAG